MHDDFFALNPSPCGAAYLVVASSVAGVLKRFRFSTEGHR